VRYAHKDLRGGMGGRSKRRGAKVCSPLGEAFSLPKVNHRCFVVNTQKKGNSQPREKKTMEKAPRRAGEIG